MNALQFQEFVWPPSSDGGLIKCLYIDQWDWLYAKNRIAPKGIITG